jgi:FkbM family methyltransferase
MPVPRLIKAVIPLRIRWALRRMALWARIRSRPFPFVVSPPQSRSALNCVVAYNKYGAYCVPVSGLRSFSALHVLAGKVWEAATLDFMAAHSKGGDLVHAGAFFGDFLPALAAAADPGAKVWAFEPHPESYRCASITIQLNRLANVELMNAGLGEKAGQELLVTRDSRGRALGGMSHMASSAAEARERTRDCTVSSPLVALDDLLPEDRPVSIIHLDVEGYEERALAGALGTLRRCRPILLVETMPGDDWIAQHLAPMGYRIAETVRDNTVLRAD